MEYLPVAFIADSNFFIPTVVALTSLLYNKKTESIYRIYIITVGFLPEQIKIFDLISEKYSTEIIICEVKEDELKRKYFGLKKHDCNASIAALIKFDLPDICAREKKVLYLDGDIIVNCDLHELCHIMVPDNVYVMAVKDTGAIYSENLIRQKKTNYFNSGVMLLNLDRMRKDEMSVKLFQEKTKSKDSTLMDQNIFNKVFENNKALLEHKYNVLYVNLIRASFFYDVKIEKVNEEMHTDYADWDDMLKRAAIVHYSSFDKPWKYSDVDGVWLWDKYYNKSEVAKYPLKRKKLHIKWINKMRSNKTTALLGTLIWEVEIKGLRRALHDAFGYMRREVFAK